MVSVAMTIGPLACARYEWVPDYETPACKTAHRPASGRSFTLAYGAAADSGSLRGRVIVSGSQRPVPGASIALLTDPPRKTATDSLGAFAFTDVSPGTYQLRTRRIGMQSREDTLHLALEGDAELLVPVDLVMLDGPCSGFAALRVRKPWWKFW